MILAIAGPKGSGKSTLARLLTQVGWKQTAFATPIKEMIGTLLKYQGADSDLVHELLYGNLKDFPSDFLSSRTPRHAMQTLGSEWRDMIARNLWTEIWVNHIRQRYAPLSMYKILVDDLRFIHEAATVHELKGKVILVNRTGCGPGEHISEQEYLSIPQDGIINNDSTPEKMLDQLGALMEYWK